MGAMGFVGNVRCFCQATNFNSTGGSTVTTGLDHEQVVHLLISTLLDELQCAIWFFQISVEARFWDFVVLLVVDEAVADRD